MDGCVVPIVGAILTGIFGLAAIYFRHYLLNRDQKQDQQQPQSSKANAVETVQKPQTQAGVVWREGNGNHVLRSDRSVWKWGVNIPQHEAEHFIANNNLEKYLS
jgi:hypothetical protein